jgi:hypothetical protein
MSVRTGSGKGSIFIYYEEQQINHDSQNQNPNQEADQTSGGKGANPRTRASSTLKKKERL